MNRTSVSFRFDSRIKEIADRISELEHRSLTNLVESLILERAKKHGIKVDVRLKE